MNYQISLNFRPHLLLITISLPKLACLIIVSAVVQSCATGGKNINTEPFNIDCLEIANFGHNEMLPIEPLLADTLLSRKYSPRSLVLANGFGLIEDLRKYEELRKGFEQAEDEGSHLLDLILIQNRINQQLDLAALELHTLANYIECKGLQLKRIRTDLNTANRKSQNALGSSAIIVGAASAILVAGVLLGGGDQLNDGDSKDWIGIAGGVAAVWLAIAQNKVNKRVMLNIRHNEIAAVWNQDNSMGLIPGSSWYLLNQPFSVVSARDHIMKTWRQSESLLGNEDNLMNLPTLLADQGSYDLNLLQLRIDMLEELEAGVEEILISLLQVRGESE